MTEPSQEPIDPRTVTRQQPHPSGGAQDDTQSPFSPGEPATASGDSDDSYKTNKTK